jgi:hypothetical protein
MVAVYQNFGSVILITIVVTTQMNPLTCVDNGTVQLVGKDVQEEPIIGVYLNGYSVMVKTIAVTVRTSCLKIVQNVNLQNLNARTIDVYQKDGCVILKTIVGTIQMSLKSYAKEYTDSVRNLNSNVLMENAFRASGDVITMTTVETIRTNSTVEDSNVKMVLSNARVVIASHRISVAMATGTAETSVTKLAVLRDILKVGTAPNLNLNAKLPSYVYSILKFVMAKTIVVMGPTKHQNFAVS